MACFKLPLVAGTGHMNFGDAPFVMPSTITRFGGQIIDPDRGLQVITTVLRAYFDQRLGRTKGGGLETATRQFPEVELRVLRQ